MTREERLDWLCRLRSNVPVYMPYKWIKSMNEALTDSIKELEQEHCENKGEISDGYHTFNQLYHQRAILFATIVNQNKDKAWKSYKHSDGKYCFDSNGEWFIVGIDIPEGSYTYHYSKEYWDMFNCKELECGKEWDGHTEEDVTRLLSLEPYEDYISRQDVLDLIEHYNSDGLGSVFYGYDEGVKFANAVNKLPSVKPKESNTNVLDKITEEIQTLRDPFCYYSEGIIDDVEDIIDKYKESEDKE